MSTLLTLGTTNPSVGRSRIVPRSTLSFPIISLLSNPLFPRYVANRGLVYLQYVDTTGLFQPRSAQKSVTRAVVQAYIGACKEAGFLRCHIFAKSNPSYLFPGSEKLPTKKSLNDSQVSI